MVPKDVVAYTEKGTAHPLNKLWSRRQTTKFNGVSYIIQRGAEAVYTEVGQKQVKALVDYYLRNAAIIREGLLSLGLQFFGGVNSPYIC